MAEICKHFRKEDWCELVKVVLENVEPGMVGQKFQFIPTFKVDAPSQIAKQIIESGKIGDQTLKCWNPKNTSCNRYDAFKDANNTTNV